MRGDADWLLETVASHGVERVIAVQPRAYGDDHAYLASVLARHGDAVIGVGYVDPLEVEPGERVARLAGMGMRGIRLDPRGDGGAWLPRERAAATWEAAARHGLAIELLIGMGQVPLLGPYLANWPQVTVVVEHMALYGEPRPFDNGPLLALAGHPNLAVKISALASLSDEPTPYHDVQPVARRVRDAFGAGRVLWGSDMPWDGAAAYPGMLSAAELIADGGDRVSLMGGTARRVFDA